MYEERLDWRQRRSADYKKAEKYYRKANMPEAKHNLAVLYSEGVNWQRSARLLKQPRKMVHKIRYA